MYRFDVMVAGNGRVMHRDVDALYKAIDLARDLAQEHGTIHVMRNGWWRGSWLPGGGLGGKGVWVNSPDIHHKDGPG